MAAVMIGIATIASFIIGYSVFVWPLEYIIDGLLDVYPSIPNPGHSVSEATNILTSLVWFFAIAVVFGILMIVVWMYAYAHKEEQERF